MTEEELIRIWQSSPNQERAKFEKSRLMIDVQSGMNDFHRKIKLRDLREMMAVAIIIPAFAYSAYAIPHLLTKIASVLTIGYALYIAFRLRTAQKQKPVTLYDSYLEYLGKSRDYLLVQKHLLDTVLYWYILPGVTLTMMFFLGFGISGRLKPILKMAMLNVGLAVATYYLNKRGVKREIMPRLQKVEELIALLEKAG